MSRYKLVNTTGFTDYWQGEGAPPMQFLDGDLKAMPRDGDRYIDLTDSTYYGYHNKKWWKINTGGGGGGGGDEEIEVVSTTISDIPGKSGSMWIEEIEKPGYPPFVQLFNNDGAMITGDVQADANYTGDVRAVFNQVDIEGHMVTGPAGYAGSMYDGSEWTLKLKTSDYVMVQVYSNDPQEGLIFADIRQSPGRINISFNGAGKTGYPVLVKPLKTYQFSNAASVTYEHGMNRYAAVQVFLSDTGEMVGSITQSTTSVTVDFNGAPHTGVLLIA